MLKVLARGWTAATAVVAAVLAGVMVSGSVIAVMGPVVEIQAEELAKYYWHAVVRASAGYGSFSFSFEGVPFSQEHVEVVLSNTKVLRDASEALRGYLYSQIGACLEDAAVTAGFEMIVFVDPPNVADELGAHILDVVWVDWAGYEGERRVYVLGEGVLADALAERLGGERAAYVEDAVAEEPVLEAIKAFTFSGGFVLPYRDVDGSLRIARAVAVLFVGSTPLPGDLEVVLYTVNETVSAVGGSLASIHFSTPEPTGEARFTDECIQEMLADGDVTNDLYKSDIVGGFRVYWSPNPSARLDTGGFDAAMFTSFTTFIAFTVGLVVVLPMLSRISIGGEARLLGLVRSRGADPRRLSRRMLAVIAALAVAGGIAGYAAATEASRLWLTPTAYGALRSAVYNRWGLAGLAVLVLVLIPAVWRPWSRMLSSMTPLEALRDPSSMIARPPKPSRAAWLAAGIAAYNIARTLAGWSAIRALAEGDVTGFAEVVLGVLAFIELMTSPFTPVLAAYAGAAILPAYSEPVIERLYRLLARRGRLELPSLGVARYAVPLLAGIIAVSVFAFALAATAGSIVAGVEENLEAGVVYAVGSNYLYDVNYNATYWTPSLSQLIEAAESVHNACTGCAAVVVIPRVTVASEIVAGAPTPEPLTSEGPVEVVIAPGAEVVGFGPLATPALVITPDPARLAEVMLAEPRPALAAAEGWDRIVRAIEAGGVALADPNWQVDVTYSLMAERGTADVQVDILANGTQTSVLAIDDAPLVGVYSLWPGHGGLPRPELAVVAASSLPEQVLDASVPGAYIVIYAKDPVDPLELLPGPREAWVYVGDPVSVEEILASEEMQYVEDRMKVQMGVVSLSTASIVLFFMVLAASVLVASASVRLLEPVLASLRLRGARPRDAVASILTPWSVAVGLSLVFGVLAGLASGGMYASFYLEATGLLSFSVGGVNVVMPAVYTFKLDAGHAALVAAGALAALLVPALRLYQLFRGPPARWLRFL